MEAKVEFKKTFEYVVVTNKDEIFVLTEKEYKHLLANQDNRFVVFPNVGTINPAYVTSIRPDQVDELKNRFPCRTCHCSGKVNGFEPCPTCFGCGADIGEN